MDKRRTKRFFFVEKSASQPANEMSHISPTIHNHFKVRHFWSKIVGPQKSIVEWDCELNWEGNSKAHRIKFNIPRFQETIFLFLFLSYFSLIFFYCCWAISSSKSDNQVTLLYFYCLLTFKREVVFLLSSGSVFLSIGQKSPSVLCYWYSFVFVFGAIKLIIGSFRG